MGKYLELLRGNKLEFNQSNKTCVTHFFVDELTQEKKPIRLPLGTDKTDTTYPFTLTLPTLAPLSGSGGSGLADVPDGAEIASGGSKSARKVPDWIPMQLMIDVAANFAVKRAKIWSSLDSEEQLQMAVALACLELGRDIPDDWE